MKAAANTATVGEIIDSHPLSRYQILILVFCFLIVMMDGFDTAVIGYIAPVLKQEWALQPSQLAPAFGAGLVGLMVGSFIFGPIADMTGRKRVLLVSLLVFGLGTLASAYSTSIGMLVALRFVTGLGLGGAMPTCITMSSEYSPQRQRMLLVTLSYSGFTTGLALGGALAAQIIPAYGWRGVLMFGGIVPLVCLPFFAMILPESVRFLASRAQRAAELRGVLLKITGPHGLDGIRIVRDEVSVHAGSPIWQLFRGGLALRTILLWSAFFCSLFVFYLLTSWLPTILKGTGLGLALASRISAMVALGGTVGAIVLALIMDRLGLPKVLGVSYLASAVALALVGLVLGHAFWLAALVFMIGFGVAGAQNGLNLLSATIYPTTARATGVSWALAVGRVGSIIGSMVGGGLMAVAGDPSTFFALVAVPCLVGGAALLAMTRLKTEGLSRVTGAAETAH